MSELSELLELQPDMAPDRRVEYPWVLSKTKPPGRVLDVGCGGSIIEKYLENHGFDVTAADIDPAARAYWNGELRRNFAHVDCAHTTWDKKFDYILVISTLEHLEPRDAFWMVLNLSKNLRAKGEIFITVPYGNGAMHVGVHNERGYNEKNLDMLLNPELGLVSMKRFTKKQIGWDAKDIFCLELERSE